MSSIRSHFRQHLQQDGVTGQQPKQSSRIPTKYGMPDGSKSSKTAHQVSKLAKRASRSILPEAAPSMKSTAKEHTVPAKTAQAPVMQSKRLSVASTPAPRHSALPAPQTIRTPSLVSGSSASTFDSPKSNGLRRKPSSAIDNYAAQRRGETAGEPDRTGRYSRGVFEDTVLGISFPHVPTYDEREEDLAYEFESYDKTRQTAGSGFAIATTMPLPPLSITPSTRYTDSPFSHAPTPSSASSYSSGIVATSDNAAWRRQPSPTMQRSLGGDKATPPSTQARPGQRSVRDPSTSSVSTVRTRPMKPTLSRQGSSHQTTNTAVAATNPGESGRAKMQHKLTKSPPSTLAYAKQMVRVPPELAHLNVEPPKPNSHKQTPPTRPSRDGTPDLVGIENPSRVVQSDLPRLYTSYHKRTPSQDTTVSRPSSSLRSRFGFSPKESLGSESPRIDSAVSPPPGTRSFHRGATPDISVADPAPLSRRDSPAIAASPSKSSRFGFLSRKSKGEVSKPIEKPKRAPTKGPAAGTGHEGYSKYGFRGRSGSTTSSAGFRSPSEDSTSSSTTRSRPGPSRQSSLASKDGSDLDDFLKERLKPVILRGRGGSVSNDSSTSDVPASNLHLVSSNTSSFDSSAPPQLLPSALRDPAGGSPRKRLLLGGRTAQDALGDDVHHRTLAARRSLTRLSQTDSTSSVRIPHPINTNIALSQSPLNSYDAEASAWPQTDNTLTPSEEVLHGREGLWLRSLPESKEKPPRKLNFFQRALASPRAKGKERLTESPEVRNSMSAQQTHRGLAHYAMMDPVEPVGLDEIGRIVRENEMSVEEPMPELRSPPKMVPYENRHVSLLPSPAKNGGSLDSNRRTKSRPPPRIQVVRQDSSSSPELLRAKTILPRQSAQLVEVQRSPNVSHSRPSVAANRSSGFEHGNASVGTIPAHLSTPELNAGDSPKQPRLSPVGRIPKVVSKRDRDRKLPDTSFSRPFARTQPRPTARPPGRVYSQIRKMASPIEFGSQPVSTTSTRSDGNSHELKSSQDSNLTGTSTNRTSIDAHAQPEFFTFPRKNSDQSYSTSSGNASWLNALYTLPPQQEDVWNEYNDLIDQVIPVNVMTPTTGSSLGAPFQYANALYEPLATMRPPVLVGPAPTADLPLPPKVAPTQNILSVPLQISRFMRPSLSPMTPDTLSGFISGYGDRSTSTLYNAHRMSLPQRSSIPRQTRIGVSGVRESVASSLPSRSSTHSRSASLPESNPRNSRSSMVSNVRFSRDTQLSDIAEGQGCSAVSTASLRRGALMTSKWLSFGRVLFSPAHNEIKFAEEPRVLVVDGLSSDWSYYVALCYPSAIVYNLSLPSAGSETSHWPDANREIPSNHRQIRMTSISAAFPFPKGFFTAVVFRFPVATTELAYQACLSECKRVLRPGGYLEAAVLDLDLMNMSAKARRTVRDLKTRMQASDPNVCLSNLSDVLVRLLGRRGFDDVQRCIVGIPAAGRIPRSRDVSSASSGSSGRPVWDREDHPTPDHEEFSFASLLEDTQNHRIGPGTRNDESITKMVAKVGRWWYSACYERLLSPGDRSIWNDRALLRECEKQGTSFRLLICHAQKPAQTRRRTVSV